MNIMEGTYTGKQLCEMVGYDYSKFIKDPRTLFNKLSKISDISKSGRGKGVKYIITQVNSVDNFNIASRSDKGEYRESEVNRMFKQAIIKRITSNQRCMYAGTLNNWLVYTNIVRKRFKNAYESDKTNDLDSQFINLERRSLSRHFTTALTQLKKEGIIEFEYLKMVIEEVELKDGTTTLKHRPLNNDEISDVVEIEAMVQDMFGIDSRNDLIYKPNELKKYDEEIKKAIKPLGYLGLYMCYRVTLKRKKDKDKIREKFNIDEKYTSEKLKDTLYDHRLKSAEARQSEFEKKYANNYFGDISFVFDEYSIDRLMYEGKYIEWFKEKYKFYVLD